MQTLLRPAVAVTGADTVELVITAPDHKVYYNHLTDGAWAGWVWTGLESGTSQIAPGSGVSVSSSGANPVAQLSAAEEASFEESLAQADRGEFATDEQVRAIWAKRNL